MKQVPFVGNENDAIEQIFQDSTGLIWLFSSDKCYVSDGEKIIERAIPFPFSGTSFLSGAYSISSEGNFYLGGDSIRIFNPYTNSIIQSIGIEEGGFLNGKTPYLHNIISSPGGIIWAALSSKEGFGFGSEYTIVKSQNGLPFKGVGIPIRKRALTSNNVVIRGDQLFVSTADTVFQYRLNGDFEKAYAFPLMKPGPIPAQNQVSKNDPIEFLHYARSTKNNTNKEKYMERALYTLHPSAIDFESKVIPGLIDDVPLFLDITEDGYWFLGERMSFYSINGNGLRVVDYSEFFSKQHPDLSYLYDVPLKVFKDGAKNIWVATNKNGVFIIPDTSSPFNRFLGDRKAYPFCRAKTCVIRGITVDEDDNIYFAFDLGIQKIDAKTGALEEVKFGGIDELQFAYSLSYYDRKLYLNELEIDPYTGETTTLIPAISDKFVTHFIDVKRDLIWIAATGTYGAADKSIYLHQYDLKENKSKLIRQIKIPQGRHGQVSQFHLSPTTNTLFMASAKDGLFEFDLDGNILKHYSLNTTPKLHYQCLALLEDAHHQLWISDANGLSKLNLLTGELDDTPYLYKGSIESLIVFSMESQNDTYVWLGTNKGLYRLNVESGEIQSFDMFPRLPNSEFAGLSSYQSPEGKLFFGSHEGLWSFHPDSLVRNAKLEEQFPVQLTQFSRFDNNKDTIDRTHKNLNMTRSFDIYPFHKYFSFDFFVPDFRDPERNTYITWLEGYESTWSEPSTSNTIRYDNLPVGEYTLHIQGGITSDYYHSSERQLKIIVHQIWYKTGWAYATYLAIFLGLIYWFNRYQINQQLEKAEVKQLKELNSLKSRLYTNITHEFRTPLTVIMGMADNIQGHSKERDLIQRNSENLLNLINQLLDLSKLDSGNIKVNFIQSDIVNYIQYLTESFYSMAKEKKIQLTFYSEIKELVMDYDEAKIQHILYNLLNNAIKFTSEEGKVILHLQQINNNGISSLQIKITDTGIGISKKNLPHIFDRFYQVESPSRHNEAGTGIGLSLTKELIEIVGGNVKVKSDIGTGTEFQILLPIQNNAKTTIKKDKENVEVTVAENKTVDISQSSVPSLEVATLTKNIEMSSILVIEDNKDVRTYIETILKKDYQIEIARNGQEGIDKALENIPDLIISDVMMPEKNGYEVCATLKEDERTSHIPIILLTAKATTKDRLEGLKGGADAYLIKPFNKEELFIRINKLIEVRQLLQERYAADNFSFDKKNPKKEPSLDEIFIQKLRKVVEERMDDQDLAVVHLCRAAKLSNMQVNRKLKALTGKTPSRFIRSIRLHKAKGLLQTTSLNISQIAYEVGFNDPHFFSRVFSEEFGHPPSVNRK